MLYERIKELCKEKGITINAMEKECGFARGSISKIDKHRPGIDKLQRIADYFDITIDELTGVQKSEQEQGYYINKETAELAQRVFKDPNLRVLFSAAEDCSPEDLQIAVDILKRLKKTNPDG